MGIALGAAPPALKTLWKGKFGQEEWEEVVIAAAAAVAAALDGETVGASSLSA